MESLFDRDILDCASLERCRRKVSQVQNASNIETDSNMDKIAGEGILFGLPPPE